MTRKSILFIICLALAIALLLSTLSNAGVFAVSLSLFEVDNITRWEFISLKKPHMGKKIHLINMNHRT